MITAHQARNNYFTLKTVHDETAQIDSEIMNVSNNGFMELIVDFTTITNPLQPIYRDVYVDLVNNNFELIDHGFIDGDIIGFRSTDILPSGIDASLEYEVTVQSPDIFTITHDGNTVDLIDEGQGITSVKLITIAEQYYKAWRYFYTYPHAEKYLTILSNIETYFRNKGYGIQRYESTPPGTLFWKITW